MGPEGLLGQDCQGRLDSMTRRDRQGMVQAPTLRRAGCYFAGRRSWCEGLAVLVRGEVPLCAECEARASTLTRLPARPLVVGPLVVLGDLVEEQRRHEQLVRQQVADARSAGATWQQVADVLGVTRQAVHGRFGPGSVVPLNLSD